MYLVTVSIQKLDGDTATTAFSISELFREDVSRDYIRGFLNEVGNRIESYDYHFDTDLPYEDGE